MTINRYSSVDEEFFAENFEAKEPESLHLNKPVSVFFRSLGTAIPGDGLGMHVPT